MRKKIYDILPPSELNKEEEQEELVEEVEIDIKEPVVKKQKFKQPRKPLGAGIKVIILGIVMLIAGFAVYFLTDTKAEVMITPAISNMQIEKEVVVSLNEDNLNENTFLLSGKVLSDAGDYKVQVPATGSADGGSSARGMIRIYNDRKPSAPLELIAKTRFLSEVNQKIYRVHSLIKIPAGKDGEPGYLEVEVVADEPGEGFNIEASKFTVPGLEGGPLHSTTWAEIVTPISGGADGTIKAVSANDLTGVGDKFMSQSIDNIKNNLLASLPDGYILINEPLSQKTSDIAVEVKEGDRVDSFEVAGTISTEMLSIKKGDLERLISNSVNPNQKNSFGYEIADIKAKNYSKSEEGYKVELLMSVNYYVLDDNKDLVDEILKKSKDEAIAKLEEKEEIEKVEVNIDPWWKNVFSSNEENIIIKLETIIK